MTRADFVAKAVRTAERALHVPPGWWGIYRDVHGPKGQQVTFSKHSFSWIVTVKEKGTSKRKEIGKYGTRGGAIGKARRL